MQHLDLGEQLPLSHGGQWASARRCRGGWPRRLPSRARSRPGPRASTLPVRLPSVRWVRARALPADGSFVLAAVECVVRQIEPDDPVVGFQRLIGQTLEHAPRDPPVARGPKRRVRHLVAQQYPRPTSCAGTSAPRHRTANGSPTKGRSITALQAVYVPADDITDRRRTPRSPTSTPERCSPVRSPSSASTLRWTRSTRRAGFSSRGSLARSTTTLPRPSSGS
jgi:hypothetical protein